MRILENNGTDITNIDGITFNNFCSGNRSGIIKGRLNECNIIRSSSSVISVASGVILINGVRLSFDSQTDFVFNTLPASTINYSIIVEIVIDSNSEITSRMFVQETNVSLIKDNLLQNENGAGTYQIELSRFNLTPEGIDNIVRVLDVITTKNKITTSLPLTLTTDGWDSSNQQKINLNINILKRNEIDVDINSIKEWGSCQVYAISESPSGITFTCDKIPTKNLTFRVTSMEVEYVSQ